MNIPERKLRPVKKIHGGTKLPHLKGTAEMQSVVMPAPSKVFIPLVQHIGAPCSPTVKKGDCVFVGTKIGEPDGFVGAPVHSSVSGTVADISPLKMNNGTVMCVTVESDGNMTPDPSLAPHSVKTAADIADAAKQCGLVGLGGAGFPTHIKLTPPKNGKIDTLIINAAECEPYITSDYRECMENYNDVMEGIYLLKETLGIKRAVICVESNKPRAIEKLYEIAASSRDADDTVKLMRLPSSYPQGAEKVLIYSATGRKLPLGKLPSDIGCIVMNVTSVGTLYRYISTGMPLVSKRITVDGTAVSKPQNIIVPIGTAVSDLLNFAECTPSPTDRIIAGGPMMGSSVASTDSVIEKRTNAILVMANEKPKTQTACIRCGRCAGACPMNLFPARVEAAYLSGNNDRFENLGVNYCMECGSCSYVCPAGRPLTQVMRVAKNELRRNKK